MASNTVTTLTANGRHFFLFGLARFVLGGGALPVCMAARTAVVKSNPIGGNVVSRVVLCCLLGPIALSESLSLRICLPWLIPLILRANC